MIRNLTRKFSNNFKTKAKTTEPSKVIRSKDFKFSKDIELGMNEESTPKAIHSYLHSHVVGQEEAKRALAIAYSNHS